MTSNVYGPTQYSSKGGRKSTLVSEATETAHLTKQDPSRQPCLRIRQLIRPPNYAYQTQPACPPCYNACLDERYYTYFIDQLSILLIIHDNSVSANPDRIHFPDFARPRPWLALGALHMANSSVGVQINKHLQQAMSNKYGEVVQLFRTRHVFSCVSSS
ncbi:C6 transcription factor [Penicillium taxi]|uniref:C6 transcription factor n=1 Tax=Penicillium taxi TaxID=168475 RepID=UPI002544EE25|nr:C6 transcription factor [Penicillium taxi]KAJ5894915.1 C6 transcription factor [Penicillium taxi]